MKITEAITTLTEELSKDKSEGSYYYSWQANIAMSFYDELITHEFGSRIDIDKSEAISICNKAAKRFLDQLCHKPEIEPAANDNTSPLS